MMPEVVAYIKLWKESVEERFGMLKKKFFIHFNFMFTPIHPKLVCGFFVAVVIYLFSQTWCFRRERLQSLMRLQNYYLGKYSFLSTLQNITEHGYLIMYSSLLSPFISSAFTVFKLLQQAHLRLGSQFSSRFKKTSQFKSFSMYRHCRTESSPLCIY